MIKDLFEKKDELRLTNDSVEFAENENDEAKSNSEIAPDTRVGCE